MPKLKLCGLNRREDILVCNEVRPDYAGFVFAPGSKRAVTMEQARVFRSLLHPDILAVGVFVNASADEISSLCHEGTIDIVQLHGLENEAFVQRLRAQITAPIIRAFGIKTRKDVERARGTKADFPLLDTVKAGVFGGTGEPFDWSVISQMERPFFLAGGLREENILEAAKLHPYCLDVSSGVETNGRKDAEKIRRLVSLVRSEEDVQR